jgi:hypothetical protein
MTTTLICPCTFVDGKVYPDPNQECPNGHTRGQAVTMPKPRRRRTKTAIHTLVEGGFLVRGTDDPTEALRVAVDELPNGDYWELDDLVAGIARDADDETLTDEDKAINAVDAAHYFANRLNPQNHTAGLMRMAPCFCGDHSWHWMEAKAPGRGVFKGVVFE